MVILCLLITLLCLITICPLSSCFVIVCSRYHISSLHLTGCTYYLTVLLFYLFGCTFHLVLLSSIVCSYLTHFLAQTQKTKKICPKENSLYSGKWNFQALILKNFLYFLIFQEVTFQVPKIKKIRPEKISFVSGNRNPEKISYISGNGNPKILFIFQGVTFWSKKKKRKKAKQKQKQKTLLKTFLYFRR